MRPFNEWYDKILAELDRPTRIRNWTQEARYHDTRSTEFTAQTYRSMTSAEHAGRAWAGPNFPEDVIICTPLDGKRYTGAGRVMFKDAYLKWQDYRNGKINRKELGSPTPYVLSLLKKFEGLMKE